MDNLLSLTANLRLASQPDAWPVELYDETRLWAGTAEEIQEIPVALNSRETSGRSP